MNKYWQVKKVLENSEYKIEFQWLMEDMRDIMCDSLKPQMERVQDHNRIVAQRAEDNVPCCSIQVSNLLGNYYYKLFKSNSSGWGDILDCLYLDVCAYHDDFSSYSDTYKDIYNVRPHYTQNQWDDLVRAARKKGL